MIVPFVRTIGVASGVLCRRFRRPGSPCHGRSDGRGGGFEVSPHRISEAVYDPCEAVRIPGCDCKRELDQLFLHPTGNASHQPAVEQRYFSIRTDKDVSRMGISMEESILVDHLKISIENISCRFFPDVGIVWKIGCFLSFQKSNWTLLGIFKGNPSPGNKIKPGF